MTKSVSHDSVSVNVTGRSAVHASIAYIIFVLMVSGFCTVPRYNVIS